MDDTSRREHFHAITRSGGALLTELPTNRGTVVLVALDGEIDLCSVTEVEKVAHAALAERPLHLVVDLAEVRFCDVRGLRLLTDTLPREARQTGVSYTLADVPRQLAHLMALVRPYDRPQQRATTAEALSAIASELVATGSSEIDLAPVRAAQHAHAGRDCPQCG